jgi:4-alpha-glucanotransferase
MHLSALGPGALGAAGRRFVDWLAAAGFRTWQVLPVGPAGADGSPYWVRSDYAGNPSFVDRAEMPAISREEAAAFRATHSSWLEDYMLFEAISARQGSAHWCEWPPQLRDRDPQALAAFQATAQDDIERLLAMQYAFDVQWRALRGHAHARGVELFGDLPIYVAPDSVETWAHRRQFDLTPDGRPRSVAGVPPDYFAAEGQLWGNPLYDWSQALADGFSHWRARVRGALSRFDLLRIDHFRGLESHWAVPATAASARAGEWRATPGFALLDALQRDWPQTPFVAEDLGVITADVERLRTQFALPGMHVIQFGFDGTAENPHLPHMHQHDSVVYSGTHDNDTTTGWALSLDADALRRVLFYFRARPGEINEAVLRATLGSVGRLAMLPMQDILGLGSEARFNTPGTSSGNWRWRLDEKLLTRALADRFALLNRVYGRCP